MFDSLLRSPNFPPTSFLSSILHFKTSSLPISFVIIILFVTALDQSTSASKPVIILSGEWCMFLCCGVQGSTGNAFKHHPPFCRLPRTFPPSHHGLSSSFVALLALAHHTEVSAVLLAPLGSSGDLVMHTPAHCTQCLWHLDISGPVQDGQLLVVCNGFCRYDTR